MAAGARRVEWTSMITPTWASSIFAGAEAEYVARQNRPNPEDFVTGSTINVNFDLGIGEKCRMGGQVDWSLGSGTLVTSGTGASSVVTRNSRWSPVEISFIRVSTDRF